MSKVLAMPKPYFDHTVKTWKGVIELPLGPNGTRKRKIVNASTKDEVKTKAKRFIEDFEKGRVDPTGIKTVKQFLDWWQSEALPGTVSEGTEDTYERTIRLWINPYVGHIRLNELTPAHVTGMLRSLQKQGLSVSSRSMARRTLARALRRAEQESWVVRNSARIADGPRTLVDQEVEQRSLTPEEAHQLLEHAKGDRFHGLITLQLALGLRRGEALGLTWPLIDLDGEHPQVTIRNQIQRRKNKGLVLCPVKTKKSKRTLSLPAPLVELLRLEQMRAELDQWNVGDGWKNEHDLVFANPMGSPVDPDVYRKGVTRLAAEAGVGHIATHTLRHSMGSFLYALGVPTKTISEMLGHSSTRVTEDVYLHVQQESMRNAAQVMESVLWK